MLVEFGAVLDEVIEVEVLRIVCMVLVESGAVLDEVSEAVVVVVKLAFPCILDRF